MSTSNLNQRQLLKALLRMNELRLAKKFKPAIALGEELIAEYGIDEYLASVIASCYFVLGSSNSRESGEHYVKAITWISKAIELSPDSPSLHADLGEYYWLGLLEYEKAAFEFRKALELNPRYIRALLGLAALFGPPESIVTLDEAVECLERARIIEPNTPTYHGRLGQLYLEKGLSSDAEEEWLRALLSSKPLDQGYVQLIQDYLAN